MTIQKQKITITGMTCGHCEKSVNSAISELGKGIISATADKNDGSVTVEFEDALVSAEQIRAAVNETGIYSAA